MRQLASEGSGVFAPARPDAGTNLQYFRVFFFFVALVQPPARTAAARSLRLMWKKNFMSLGIVSLIQKETVNLSDSRNFILSA